jgi:hypothetical protein
MQRIVAIGRIGDDERRVHGQRSCCDCIGSLLEGRGVAGKNRCVPFTVRSLAGALDQSRAGAADRRDRMVEARALRAAGSIAQDENEWALPLHPVE